jgi:hypothetical protein
MKLKQRATEMLLVVLVVVLVMACTTPATGEAPTSTATAPTQVEAPTDSPILKPLSGNPVMDFFVWLMCWPGSTVCPSDSQ